MKTLEDLFKAIICRSNCFEEAEIWLDCLGCSDEEKETLRSKLLEHYGW